MFNCFTEILTLISSFLIISSFFVNIYLVYKRLKSNKESINRQKIKLEIAEAEKPQDLNKYPLTLKFTFNDKNGCESIVYMGDEHLEINRHHNFLLNLESILIREKERHKYIKNARKNKFKLLQFKKPE